MECYLNDTSQFNTWDNLQSISFIVTAMATITAATIVVWSTRQINRINNIKNHYSNFWNDKEISEVRVGYIGEYVPLISA